MDRRQRWILRIGLVGTEQQELADQSTGRDVHGTLPVVEHPAREPLRGNLDDQRPVLTEVGERDQVRRGGIGGNEPHLVVEAPVADDVAIARAKHRTVLMLPLRESHQRQAPQVRLRRALEVEFAVQLLHRGARRIPVREGLGELERAETRRDGPAQRRRRVTFGTRGAAQSCRTDQHAAEQRVDLHSWPLALVSSAVRVAPIMGAGYSLRSWCQRRYGVYQIGDV